MASKNYQGHQPQRFQNYKLLPDQSGFTLPDEGDKQVFKFNEDGGWEDENGNLYDENGEPIYGDDYNENQGYNNEYYEEDEYYDELAEQYDNTGGDANADQFANLHIDDYQEEHEDDDYHQQQQVSYHSKKKYGGGQNQQYYQQTSTSKNNEKIQQLLQSLNEYPQQQSQEICINLFNLNYRITEQEIKEYFEKYAQITSNDITKILIDKDKTTQKPTGRGRIFVPTKNIAEKIIQCEGQTLLDRQISMQIFNQQIQNQSQGTRQTQQQQQQFSQQQQMKQFYNQQQQYIMQQQYYMQQQMFPQQHMQQQFQQQPQQMQYPQQIQQQQQQQQPNDWGELQKVAQKGEQKRSEQKSKMLAKLQAKQTHDFQSNIQSSQSNQNEQ